MNRLLALVIPVALLGTAPAFAADIYAEVNGVAHFVRSTGGYTEILTGGSALPNGGRAFDFGEFSHGGALCTPFTGQTDYLCASASARVEIDRRPVQTSTYIGVATDVRLKAKSRLEYRNVPGYSVGQIWGRATVHFPIACHGSVSPPVNGLDVHYHLEGERSISSSDPGVEVEAPRPFETCTPGGVCTIRIANFRCPDEGATTNVTIDLFPYIQIHNPEYHSGWTVLAVSDYSHTLAITGMEVLGADNQPMPGVRAVVPDATGGANDTFLTATEYAEIATTTTTTLSGSTSTTVPGGSTTTTTLPACAGTTGVAAANCRCNARPVAGCEGVTLKGAIGKGVDGLCTTVGKAISATGKKQTRLVRRATGLAKRALTKVNGRKGAALGDACRGGLQSFIGLLQTDLATP